MGWYDGNPSDLNDLPPAAAAKKYVEYMGGEAAVLEKAKNDFDNGEYRWTAMALKHVVFANPNNVEARTCWPTPTSKSATRPIRTVALGVPAGRLRAAQRRAETGGINTASPDTIRAMPPECCSTTSPCG